MRLNSYMIPSIAILLLLATACGKDEDPGTNTTTPVIVENNTTPAGDDMGSQRADMSASPDMNASPDMSSPGEEMGSGEDMNASEDMGQDMGSGEDMGAPAEVDRSDLMGDGRPAKIFIPESYDNAREVPLVVMLHGYGASGSIQNSYFRLTNQVDAMDFILITPDGMIDANNSRFWNAADACCDFANTMVDDVGYITGLIDEAKERYAIDAGRVYLIGHSNGGFMSYRLACEASETITAIASLAGTTFSEASSCTPSQPVGVLQIHGTMDETIAYEGGAIFGKTYPGAVDTAARWGEYNGCSTEVMAQGTRTSVAGAGDETDVQSHVGCPEGGGVTLWTINGGSHIPNLKQGWVKDPLEHLFAYDRTP